MEKDTFSVHDFPLHEQIYGQSAFLREAKTSSASTSEEVLFSILVRGEMFKNNSSIDIHSLWQCDTTTSGSKSVKVRISPTIGVSGFIVGEVQFTNSGEVGIHLPVKICAYNNLHQQVSGIMNSDVNTGLIFSDIDTFYDWYICFTSHKPEAADEIVLHVVDARMNIAVTLTE